MDPADLDLRDLLAPAPHGGTHVFASHRIVLVQTGVLWTLREQLIEQFGATTARSLLIHIGCAWGSHTAASISEAVPWRDAAVWTHALPQLQALVGLGVRASPTGGVTPPRPLAWSDSFEAHHYRAIHTRSTEPVCWMLTGFAAGYLSRSLDRPVTCDERTCIAMGDSECRFDIRITQDALAPPTCLTSGRRREPPIFGLSASDGSTTERHVADAEAQQLGVYSPAMRHVFDVARRVAPLDSTVLITGESGVGKERLAQYIHDHSQRQARRFVAINCGAVSETLLESELFGHSRGAFTGAHHDRAGLFEAAEGGSLLLDEVGEMPLSMQVKLLRVLQKREVRRLGENRSRPVDVRIIAATNRDLARDVALQHFREDLYYRLRVVELHIPPLRERPEDLRALLRVLLAEAAQRMPCTATGFTPLALDALLRYHWPGNVRELENAIERACVMATGPLIDLADLPESIRHTPSLVLPTAVVRPLRAVERDYILAALAANDGNRERTAKQLGISRATLFRKLHGFAHPNKTPTG